MTETRIHREPAAVERSPREGSIGLVVLLALALVGMALALTMMGRDEARPLILGLLAFLAVIGVFALFAAAVGMLRFSDQPARDDLPRALAEAMPEGVLVTARSGRILYANPAYLRLTGASTPEEVRGVERAFAGDAEISEALFRLARAAAVGRRAEEEVRIETSAEGERTARWLRIRVQPLERRGRGEILWEIGDVTGDRGRQEDVFRELQRAIDNLDHAPVGFFSHDGEGRLRYVNATLAEWLGYDLAETEMARLTIDEIVSGEGAALLRQMPPAPGEVRAHSVDVDLVRRNGKRLPVRLLHKIAFDAEGRPGIGRTVVLDRSPGGDESETLRAAEVRFARFFNSTPLAIAAIGRDGGVRRSNAAFAKLFPGGSAGRDGGTQRALDLVVETDRPPLEAMLEACFAGRAELKPVDATLATGQSRIGRFFGSPIEDGDGEAAILYVLDITEQKAMESQFAQGQKMQAVGQLAGGVAHDFNNLLTAIIGFSDLLLANHRPTDPSFNDIMNIKHNANRAAALVRQLLAFSRQQTLRPQILRLGDVMGDLQMLLTRLLGPKIELSLEQERDLWLVEADLTQLDQVVVNLAVNARDAMPDGGRLTIRTRNVPGSEAAGLEGAELGDGDHVMIEVEDTGTGIPPEVVGKIFDPFFTTKEVGKGTGLGLSTVYGIVKQSGGAVTVDSEPGRGARFRIYLPRHLAESAESTGARKTSEPERDLTGQGTVLLVEDEKSVRAFAARALTSRGYTVLEAETGAAALALMDRHGDEIDLVVSDVVMPEMDGPTLLKELRRRKPDLKFIFVSGYAEDAFKKSLEGDEDFHFLPKPFNLKELAAMVKRVTSA